MAILCLLSFIRRFWNQTFRKKARIMITILHNDDLSRYPDHPSIIRNFKSRVFCVAFEVPEGESESESDNIAIIFIEYVVQITSFDGMEKTIMAMSY